MIRLPNRFPGPGIGPSRASCVLAASLLTLSLTVAPPSRADGDVTVSGQVRARTELDKKSFADGAVGNHFTDLRTRLTVTASPSDNTGAVIQLQDSRRLGGTDVTGSPASGGLSDGEGVDVHQAYLEIRRLWKHGPGLKAGRFEVNLGNQRVFGSVGWHNVGRSWEGMSLCYPISSVTPTVYWLKRTEMSDPARNRDFDIWGLHTSVPRADFEVFAFYEHDAESTGRDTTNAADNRLDRIDLGLYRKHTHGRIDTEVNAVYQLGERASVVSDLLAEQDISAFLVTAEVGLTLSNGGATRLAAGIDYASGDDDPDDDTWKAYDNLYYTGHKFRGYMDYFLGSGPGGLVDLMLRGSTSPGPGWKLSADAHIFATAVDYVDFAGKSTNAVGIELDLGVSTTRIAGVLLDGGASVFLPSDSFAGTSDPDPGLWVYSMLTANFGGK